jgi:redox-sensitive bicupin YhaK (pirin superfamily)
MLEGRMRHRDSAGNEGLLENGGVQWMTAGRGVIHSEMPEQEEGRMEGFQLWLNLPAKDKMSAPWYRDFAAADLPRFATDAGADVQVIAGSSHGVAGAVQRDATEVLYLDIKLAAGGRFEQVLPAGHNAFICVYRGEVQAGEMAADQPALGHGQMAIMANEGDGIRLSSATGGRAILVAGKPLGEPIVQHGPFVMNSTAEIQQAIDDYQSGRLA